MFRDESYLRTSSAALVAATKGGNRAAFDEIFRRYHRVVAKRVVLLLGPGAHEEDLIQETFERAYRQIKKYRGDAPFAHWLLRIASNLSRSAYRRRSRRLVLGLAEGAREEQSRYYSRYPELAALHSALEGMSASLREAVLLHDVEGLTLREVAAVQGIGSNTAASRVRRGRERLRRRLIESGFADGSERKAVELPANGDVAATGLCKGELI